MPFYTCSLRGTLAAATLGEIFVHTFTLESAASQAAVGAGINQAWDAAWAQPDGSIGNLYSNQTVYTESTAAQILTFLEVPEADIHPTVAAATHTPFNPPLVGTISSGFMPSQLAVAVSLRGGTKPNGAPMKGRIFTPCPAATWIDYNGTLKPAGQDSLADGFQLFFEALENLGHTGVIWSRTFDETTPIIEELRVGNKIDTQRRRRNELPEAYVVRPLTGPQRREPKPRAG